MLNLISPVSFLWIFKSFKFVGLGVEDEEIGEKLMLEFPIVGGLKKVKFYQAHVFLIKNSN